MCVQKVAGASPDRWGHGAPMRQRGPPGRGDSVSVFVSPSYHKTSRLSTSGRLLSSMTSPISLSMRCRSLRIRTRKASLVSFCSRHDLSRHISRCLFLSHKTRSVQDTICSRHISRCLFLSHTPCQLLRSSSTWRPFLPSPTQRLLQ